MRTVTLLVLSCRGSNSDCVSYYSMSMNCPFPERWLEFPIVDFLPGKEILFSHRSSESAKTRSIIELFSRDSQFWGKSDPVLRREYLGGGAAISISWVRICARHLYNNNNNNNIFISIG